MLGVVPFLVLPVPQEFDHVCLRRGPPAWHSPGQRPRSRAQSWLHYQLPAMVPHVTIQQMTCGGSLLAWK